MGIKSKAELLGISQHPGILATAASFRIWRGSQGLVARGPTKLPFRMSEDDCISRARPEQI